MEYKYRVYEEVYNDILLGKKSIEFRLLNEKSKQICIGDVIKFIVVDDENKFLSAEVLDKYIYENLEELWESKAALNNTLNYTKEEFYDVFNKIFGKEQIDKSKIVGFKIKVIKQ